MQSLHGGLGVGIVPMPMPMPMPIANLAFQKQTKQQPQQQNKTKAKQNKTKQNKNTPSPTTKMASGGAALRCTLRSYARADTIPSNPAPAAGPTVMSMSPPFFMALASAFTVMGVRR